MFALIDCSNFYASCERVFQPNLNGKPIIVLSNNDGCVIARSDEAKALGIEMGAPMFKIRDLVEWNKIHVFSSNFALYGDMSRRVMDIIQSHIQDVEIYSVDEAFVEFPKNITTEQAIVWARDIRAKILQWTGIPTRVGIGSTKTLAKLGNALAKQRHDGVMHVGADDTYLFKDLPISKIWGYGKQFETRLKRYAIHTVGQLLNKNREWVRKVLTVTGERTYYELKGVLCYPLSETIDEDQKSLIVSRSFAEEVRDFEPLKNSIVSYCNNAGEKLRNRGLFAYNIGVYIRSSPFKDGYYSNFTSIQLNQPTQDTRTLIKAALESLERIYKHGVGFKKSGILLGDLTNSGDVSQLALNLEKLHCHGDNGVIQGREPKPLLAAVDRLNKKYGRNTVTVGAITRKENKFIGKRNYTSPRYTTRWTDIIKV
jgi:DNA polymerase V